MANINSTQTKSVHGAVKLWWTVTAPDDVGWILMHETFSSIIRTVDYDLTENWYKLKPLH